MVLCTPTTIVLSESEIGPSSSSCQINLLTVRQMSTYPLTYSSSCQIDYLLFVRSVLFFDGLVIIWVYLFFSLVARTATLGNSCNLHKSKMAILHRIVYSSRSLLCPGCMTLYVVRCIVVTMYDKRSVA